MPVGIEHDHAKWLKVKRAAGEALTQVRGKIKKLVRLPFHDFRPASRYLIQLVKSTKPRNNKAQHMDIFDLTKAIVKNTEYKVTLPLMARVALMVRQSHPSMLASHSLRYTARGIRREPG